MNYRLSPSDLTFLYTGCKYCFYQKVANGISQPSIPLPSIFSKIAGLLKDHYDGKRTSELHVDIPPGIITHGEKWVRSEPIKLPNHQFTCYINGRFDIVVSFDDGSYGVIDFKTQMEWQYQYFRFSPSQDLEGKVLSLAVGLSKRLLPSYFRYL